jgi:MOSC domain-containing protein YiiM
MNSDAQVADVRHGSFGENLVVLGFSLSGLAVGTVLPVGAAELCITQTGKECHHG